MIAFYFFSDKVGSISDDKQRMFYKIKTSGLYIIQFLS